MSPQQTRISAKKSSSIPMGPKYTPAPVLQPKATKKPDRQLPEWQPEGGGMVSPLQRLLDSNAVQAKLTIGEPNDKYEQEADTVAQDVVQRLHSPLSEAPPETEVQRETEAGKDKLQMKPILQRTHAVGGEPASADLEGAINRAKGGGQPLEAGLQRSMSQAMGADFSGVRVHTDGHADELNQSIQAKAFTTGQDVFFKQGEYQPGSRGGQELIAHELTHVVQQGGAASIPANVQRNAVKEASNITINSQTQISKMPEDSALLIQRDIETNGGKWKTDSYKTVSDGAEIILDFAPNDNVKATKIGLIQKSLKVEKGINYDISARSDYESKKFQMPTQKRKAQRSDGQSHIDRDIRMNNPIYGAPNLAQGKDLSATPTGKLDMSDKAQQKGTAQNYQLGWRYKSMLGLKTNKRSAKLYDKPNLPGATNAVAKDSSKKSKMTFETTAVCIQGKQKGMYYGSVGWGFTIDDASGATLLPLRKLTDGVPTKEMIGVMKNWNEGEFNQGELNPQIPIPTTDEEK